MKKKFVSLALCVCLLFTMLGSTSLVTSALDVSWWNTGGATITGNDVEGYDIQGGAFTTPRTWVENEKGPDVSDFKMKFDFASGNWFYVSIHVNDSAVDLSNFEGITLLFSKNNNTINVGSWENSGESGVLYSLTGDIAFDYSKEHTIGFVNIENQWYFRMDGIVYSDRALTDRINNIFSVCEQLEAVPQYAFSAQSDYTIENLRWVNRMPYSISATLYQTGKYGVSWHSVGEYEEPQIQFGLNKDAPVAPKTFVDSWSTTDGASALGNENDGFDISGSAWHTSTIEKYGDFSKHDLTFKFSKIDPNCWGYIGITNSAPGDVLPQTIDGLYILLNRSAGAGNDVNIMLWNGTNTDEIFGKIENFDFTSEHTLGFDIIDNKWYMTFDGVTYTESNGGLDLTSYLSALVDGNNYYRFNGSSEYMFEDLKFVNADSSGSNNYLSVSYAETTYCEASGDYLYKGIISNVEGGQTYYYRVGNASTGAWSDWRTFIAQEADDSAFTFIHVTDTHIGSDTVNGGLWPSVMSAANEKHGDSRFILHTGDLVDGLNDYSQWKDAFSNNNGGIGDYLKNTLITSVAGSYHESSASELYDHFNFYIPDEQDTSNGIYYSYDYNDAHFVMIDVNDITTVDKTTYSGGLRAALSEKQEKWLKEDLSSTDKNWKIVGIHWSLYGSGGSAQDENVRALRNYLIKLFDEYNVDLVLSGHDHIFERTLPLYSRNDILDYWDSGAVRPGSRVDMQYGNDEVTFDVNPNGTVFIQTGSIATNKATTSPYAYTTYYDKQSEVALPMYSAITIDGDKLVVKSYTVENGVSTLYDSYGIIHDNKADANGDMKIDIRDLVYLKKQEYPGLAVDLTSLRKKLLTFYYR